MNGKAALLLTFFSGAAFGHAVSMSTGEIAIDGARARYELRMPLYEIAHTQAPERTLLDHIRFFSGGREAREVARKCAPDAGHSLYLCSAEYEFAAPVERLDVECSFAAVTVPNHVHVLHASMPGKRDQAVLDLGFPRATLRFRPPTPAEIAFTQTGAGAVRALNGLPQLLFLASLVLAARMRRELVELMAAFGGGQAISTLMAAGSGWAPSTRFVEAADALTVAYLAGEILFLPKARGRWLIAGMLGAVHGLFVAGFMQSTGYSAGFLLVGAMLAQVCAVAVVTLAFSRTVRLAQVLQPVPAGLLLVIGLSWFLVRLRS